MADIRIRTHGQVNHVVGRFQGLPRRMRSTLVQATGEATDILHRHTVGQINRRTGRTGGTVRKSVRPTTRGAHGEVWSDDPVFKMLDRGTRGPYTIEPVGAKSLRFEWRGRIIFTKRVTHPGIEPQNILDRGVAAAGPEINRLYDQRIAREL